MKKELIIILVATLAVHFNNVTMKRGLGEKTKHSMQKKLKKETIFDAINNNDIESVKAFLNEPNADVNIQNSWGNTPLHLAAYKGNLDIAELIIKKNVDVNAKSYLRNTPLHVAARSGNLKIVKLLIDKRANLNAKNHNKDIPLHVAAEYGHLDIVELLIESDANLSAQNKNGYTPLHEAALRNHLDITELFIKSGADVNIQSNLDNTPLHVAAKYGYKNIVKLLIAAPSLVLQLEQSKDKADKLEQGKEEKYKLNLNDLKPKKKKLLKEWFNRESMFDLLMSKTDDKSNNENSAPFLCLELIADKLFETPFKNPIELHNAKAFLKRCFINKDIVNTENQLKYPGAQCFIGALYKNHLSKLKNYIIIKNDEDQTAIEITDNENIKKHLKDIQDAESYTNLKNELKELIEHNYKK